MSNLEKPDDWTEEEFAEYLGSADDPMNDEAVFESGEILDLYAGYDAANQGTEDGGTTA